MDLRHGDVDVVLTGLARLRGHGTGATRQRLIHHRTGDLTAVLAAAADLTVQD
jgi:carboxylate-amine ligase